MARTRIEIDVVTGEETIVPYTPAEEAAADAVAEAPAPAYRLYKSAFINRMNETEAQTMELVLSSAPAKLRLLFNSVEYFVSDDPLFIELHDAVAGALGPGRADDLLAE